jgi:hypothetical protein
MTVFCNTCGREFSYGTRQRLFPINLDVTGGIQYIYTCNCCEKEGEK